MGKYTMCVTEQETLLQGVYARFVVSSGSAEHTPGGDLILYGPHVT